MKTICIVTATRAEYGIMKNLIRRCFADSTFCTRLVVTGSHLSEDYGMTYQEIEADAIPIDAKIDILSGDDDEIGIVKTMSTCMNQFAEYFSKSRPDMLLVLGDRYEIMAVCTVAMVTNIPIAHIYGGETTEGAIDEAIRHSITKMSYLHFTSTEKYRQRVIQLGESPDRVFCVGSLGVENILTEKLLSKEELEQQLCMNLSQPYAIVTYHPVTIKESSIENEVIQLLRALERHPEMTFILTKANADSGGQIVNEMMEHFSLEHTNVKLFSSLGMTKYLSALKYTTMVIGNSSSGIVEAPSFRIPTVNIGDRQKGRIQAESIINCDESEESIFKAIEQAKKYYEQNEYHLAGNPYEGTEPTEAIIKILRCYMQKEQIPLRKKFYDLEVEE